MTTTTPTPQFTHLHTHTEYSMLDGISRIPDLVDQAVQLDMKALAITDHGSLYGAVDFYSECKERGIKPIIGCETYVAKQSRSDRGADERSPHHLVLLAQDNEGYRNLMQLVTLAHTQGFHYRPRVDREILERYSQGLIVLSGCASAEVPRLLADGRMAEAKQAAGWYREIFQDGYFLELQRHEDVPTLPAINEGLITLSQDLSIPLVVTNDAHYVRQPDAQYQDVYICIQTNTTIQDEKRLRMEDNSYYIKSAHEMAQLFPDHPEALERTQEIADMCNVELGFGQTHLPRYHTPDNIDADEYLAQLCWKGFAERYPGSQPAAEAQLKYELGVIRHTQFANYFLVVWDIIDFVRRSQILFGVRGSAAASVALYCLGITDVEPMKYSLVFERFLNMERKEMPDIDMDFQDDRRDEVLHYVIQKYGNDRVAQIITFGTMGAKAALRDVGRGMGMSYGDVDRIARMVPQKSKSIEDAMKSNQDFQDAYDNEQDVRTLVDSAKGLEGIVHHVSTHAAGVLISDDPLTSTVPLQRPSKGDENSPVMMTQYSMDPVAKLGLLKMDFLGLTNLTILDRATRLLQESQGISINLSQLPLDDPETFQLLSSGKTTEVFQLESSGMRRYIRELQPSTLQDISAMIALYRPGPMEHVDTFIGAKHGRIPTSYPHPSLKEILDETYGVIVYQDQVLFILQSFAGYSLGAADTVRKAMGKKIASLMAEERDKFIQGATGQGFDQETATKVFDLIQPFAGYAFNKAHSISYALISYWTAYFKAHHPRAYMASVLNSRLDHPDKVVGAINECFKLQIPVLAPDINSSGELFTIDDSGPLPAIRTGLAAVKTVGEAAVRPLVEERKANGPYTSIDDFCKRADVSALNRRTLESLTKAGAFDAMGKRGAVLAALDQIMSTAQMESKNRLSGQTSLFDTMPPQSAGLPGINLSATDATPEEKAGWERELIGAALTRNPLIELARIQDDEATSSLDDLSEDLEGQNIQILGHISSIRQRYTREQKKFLAVMLDMLGGTLEVTVWPDILEITQDRWQEGKLVRVGGKLRVRGDQLSVTCEDVQEYILQESDGPELPGSEEPELEPEEPASELPETEVPASEEPTKTTAKTPGSRTPESNGTQPRKENTKPKTQPEPERPQQMVLLHISESEDTGQDQRLIREAVQTLRNHPGQDQVHLEITTRTTRVLLELPNIRTEYCPALEESFIELLGQNSVTVEAA